MGLGQARGKRAVMGSLLGAGIVVAVIAACNGKKNNELVLALQTDLSIPKDVDTIRIEVVQAGKTLFQQDYPVGPDGAHIPATLGVVDNPDAPGQPVKIRILARQKTTLRVLRQARTSIPSGRVATLRMPIHWLCWNQVIDPGDGGDPQTLCPDGQSCINGVCADESVDPAKLLDFNPADIFGGGSGHGDGVCFDTIACFSHGAMVPVQTSDCTIAKPADADAGAGINVAMARKPGVPGICSDIACFIPMDSDPDFGWQEVNGRIQLPSAVCDRLALPASNKLSIVGLATTTACSTKTAQIPTCGPWSSVAADSGTFEASAPAGFDAGPGEGGTILPDGGTCDTTIQWPKMLAAPIVPPNQIAGLDLSNGGKGVLTVDQAELVNCAGTTASPIDPGTSAIAWGTNGDVFVEYDSTTHDIVQVAVQKGYTGQLSFDGAGTHYAIGIGTLQANSAAITINWANANTLVQQIYDAYMATYFGGGGDANCFSTGDCFVNANATATASGIAIGVNRTFPLYMVFPKNGSAPNELYTTRKAPPPSPDGGADASAPDAGPVDAGGG
jgi:hypothetical protein